MLEPLDTLLVVASVAGTIWLAFGLLVAQRFSKQSARAHAILVAASVGTLLTPLFYLVVRQANGGLLTAKIEPVAPLTSVETASTTHPLPFQPALHAEANQNHSQIPPGAPPRGIGVAYSPSPLPGQKPVTDLTHAASPTDTKSPGAAWVSPTHWKRYLAVGWLLGSFAMVLHLLRDFAAGSWLIHQSQAANDPRANEILSDLSKRMGTRIAPQLAISDRIGSPVLWAWSAPPRILIPFGGQKEIHREALYLHELAHLARRDHLSALVAELVLCFLPWHPLAWWTRRWLDALAEEACDDWAVASGCDPLDYAHALVSLAPTSAGTLRLAAVSKNSPLKSRIRRLLCGNSSIPLVGKRWVAGLGSFSLLMAAATAMVQPRTVLGEHHNDSPEAVASADSGDAKNSIEDQAKRELEVLILLDGKPAEGATIWMEGRTIRASEKPSTKTSTNMVGPVTAPKSGIVRFSLISDPAIYQVFATNDQGRVGIGSYTVWSKHAPTEDNRIVLNLQRTEAIKGQLFFENQPLANALCQVASIDNLSALDHNNRPLRGPAARADPPQSTDSSNP